MLLSGISLAIEESIMKFLLWIDSVLLELLQKLYIAYFQLAKLRIFSVGNFDNLINNVYLVVGVVALFMLAFILLQSMIDPNGDKGTKQILDLIKRFVVLSTITCLIPTFFDFLGDIQNSILTYNVIPNTILSDANSIEYQVKDESTGAVTTETISVESAASDFFAYRVSSMVITLMEGLMYPTDQTNKDNDGNLNTLTIDASTWWNADTQLSAVAWGCGISLTGALIFTAATGGWGSVSIPKAIAICALGAGVAYTGGAIGDAIDAKAFSWEDAKMLMLQTGDFKFITLFAEAISIDDMHYTPILSTIAIGFMIYMMVSFCIDLAVRAAKLVFYQVMAPICFLVGIVPQKKELVTNWFKAVITTWAEVFIRVGCVCGVVLLVGSIDFDAIKSSFGGARFISTLLILGMVIFVKEIPKLLKDITGIDSGNMKLGIKDKLAAGGAFTVGAALGGGVTALTRNGIAGIRNVKDNWKDAKGVKGKAGLVAGALASTAAGGISGFARSAKSGWGAKSAADMKKSASSGASDAVSARDKRAAYKARHGGTYLGFEENADGKWRPTGSLTGHITDTWRDVQDWAGVNNISDIEAINSIIGDIQSQRKAIDDEAFSIIDGDYMKGKNSTAFSSEIWDEKKEKWVENDIAKSLGIKHSMRGYRALKSNLETAKSTGYYFDEKGKKKKVTPDMLDQLERDVSNYRAKWADELKSVSLLGNEAWDKLAGNDVGRTIMADLAKERSKASEYRETVARNVHMPFMENISDDAKRELLNKNVSLTVKHETLDALKNELKIHHQKNADKINEVRRKERERKEGK